MVRLSAFPISGRGLGPGGNFLAAALRVKASTERVATAPASVMVRKSTVIVHRRRRRGVKQEDNKGVLYNLVELQTVWERFRKRGPGLNGFDGHCLDFVQQQENQQRQLGELTIDDSRPSQVSVSVVEKQKAIISDRTRVKFITAPAIRNPITITAPAATDKVTARDRRE